MTLTMSPFTRKFLALALLVGVLIIIWLAIARPIERRFETYAETIAHSERLLERYRRVGGAREALEVELGQARESDLSRGGFLSGQSAELVAAKLQSTVKEAIENSGGQLRSIQVLNEAEEGNFRKIAIRVTMLARTLPLRNTLHELESSNPYLFVENVSVRARPSQSRDLQIRFDVYGYIRTDQQ